MVTDFVVLVVVVRVNNVIINEVGLSFESYSQNHISRYSLQNCTLKTESVPRPK